MSFWVWVTSLRIIFSSSIHLPVNFMMFLFLIAQYYSIFCIHSLAEGHLGCFQFLDITNKAAMNIAEQVSLRDGGASFGYTPRSGIGHEEEIFPVF